MGRYIAHMDTEGHKQAGADTGKAKTHYITIRPLRFAVYKILGPPAVSITLTDPVPSI